MLYVSSRHCTENACGPVLAGIDREETNTMNIERRRRCRTLPGIRVIENSAGAPSSSLIVRQSGTKTRQLSANQTTPK